MMMYEFVINTYTASSVLLTHITVRIGSYILVLAYIYSYVSHRDWHIYI